MNLNKSEFREFLDKKGPREPEPKVFFCLNCFKPYVSENIKELCWDCIPTEREKELDGQVGQLTAMIGELNERNTQLSSKLTIKNTQIKGLETKDDPRPAQKRNSKG